jgi:hypothetical protein
MQSGVYKITCTATNNFYYGSSVNLKLRFSNHISKLKSGNHRNKRLQRLFNKYGEHSITFEIIELCTRTDTLRLEQAYLDTFNTDPLCINFCKDAAAPMSGIKFSDQHKYHMSQSLIKFKYSFTFEDGHTENFNGIKAVAERFNVSTQVVFKWFERNNLGRPHGILSKNKVIRADKIGTKSKVLLPYTYKIDPWKLAQASSKTQYYRKLKNGGKKV